MAKRSRKQTRPASAASMAGRTASAGLSEYWWKALLLVAAGLLIYGPVLGGDWLWDDDVLITDNHLVHDPWGLWKIWFQPGEMMDFTPLTVTVNWIGWHLWGNAPMGFRLLNLTLHLTSAFLVWRLLAKLGLRFAWVGGLIFVVHPVIVESVAWIAELKNTLSMPLFLLAACAYLDFDAQGKRKDYLAALGFFFAALLCKATMVMFPLVILLYVWWKRGRISLTDAKASAPFFAASLLIGLTTVWFLKYHAMIHQPPQLGGLLSRLACAGLTVSFYFWKCLVPIGLMPIYPRWQIDPPTLLQFLPWPIWAGALAWLWTQRASWGRHVLFGLGFFLINLLPFAGLTPGSYMLFTWVMDHILYIPIIGLIGLAVAGLGKLHEVLAPMQRRVVGALTATAIAALTWLSWSYAAMFQNQETLWSYTLQLNPSAWLAQSNLGNAYYRKGKPELAMAQYQKAAALKPDDPLIYYNIGNLYFYSGNPTEAVAQYQHALQINTSYAPVYANLGVALAAIGKFPDAVAAYRKGLETDPDQVGILSNLGVALTSLGQPQDAETVLRKATQIDPAYAEAHYNLGNALFQMQRIPEARDEFTEAVRLRPNEASSHNNLGAAYEHLGQIPEAITQFQLSLQIDPNNANARKNLERLQAR